MGGILLVLFFTVELDGCGYPLLGLQIENIFPTGKPRLGILSPLNDDGRSNPPGPWCCKAACTFLQAAGLTRLP